MELQMTKKEINTARKAYQRSQYPRSFGFVIWLLMALVWVGFGYLVYNVGEVSGTDDPTAALNALFGIPVILLVVLFVRGNFRSIKKHKALKAKVAAMDPALIALFEEEAEQERAAEAQRAFDRGLEKMEEEEIKREIKEQEWEKKQKRWEKEKEMIDY